MPDRPIAVDPAALERLLEMTGDDVEFLDELVDTYLEDAPTQLEAMRAAVAGGMIADLVRPAHSLKTNSANMGADALAAMCRALETEARDGHVDGADERVTAAGAEFDVVRTTLLEMRAAR